MTHKKISQLVLCLSLSLILIVMASGCSNNGSNAAEVTYKPGTYTSIQDGKDAPVTIEVTFSDKAITAVEIVKSEETAGLGDEAMMNIAKDIMDKQSLDVDMIAGATVSSEAMLKAVTDCVTQAGGDVELLKK